jgi:hypothetical protein
LKPTSILTLGLVALALAFPAFAGQSGPSWKPSTALLAQLQPSSPVSGFSFKHPKGYTVQKGKLSATLDGMRWISPVRVDGTQNIIVATWGTIPKKMIGRYPLAVYLGQPLEMARTHVSGWSRTAPEMGTIDGHAFCRAYWSGKNPVHQVNMRGFVYVTIVGNKLVEIGSHDYVPDEEKYLALAEAAILTFKAN